MLTLEVLELISGVGHIDPLFGFTTGTFASEKLRLVKISTKADLPFGNIETIADYVKKLPQHIVVEIRCPVVCFERSLQLGNETINEPIQIMDYNSEISISNSFFLVKYTSRNP